jgi:PAS domain S-box-containing protein
MPMPPGRTRKRSAASHLPIPRTARKRPARLGKSSNYVQAILDASQETTLLIDREGTVLACNLTTASRLGLEREDLLGRCVYDVLSPEVAARRKSMAMKVFDTGAPVDFEDERNGRIMQNHLRPIANSRGEVVHIAVFGSDVTDQRVRESALNQSRTKYRLLFESTSEGMFLADPNGTVQEANPAACAMMGRSLDDIRMMGRPLIVHPDERFHAAFEERARTGRFAGELTYVRADGSLFPVELESVLLPQEDGPPWAFTIFRDITARRQALFERESTVAFLEMVNASAGTRALAEAAAAFFQQQSGCESVGIRLEDAGGFPYVATRGLPAGVAGPAGRDTTLDGSGCAVLECLCGKIIRNELDLLHPLRTRAGGFWTNHASRIAGEPDAPDCMLPGRRVGFESLALLPLAMGQLRLGLLELSDPRPNRFTQELISLWERLAGQLTVALAKARAEESLRVSEERYRQIVDTAQEGIWAADTENRTIYVNRRMADMMGYSPEEMIGRYAFEFLFPEDVPSHREQLNIRQRMIAGQYEKRGRRKDGSEVWTIASASPLRDADGRYAGSFAMFTDITARKRAEEAGRLFEKMASSAVDNLTLIGRGYRYRAANQAMLKRCGLGTSEDIVGRHVSEIMGAEVFERIIRPRMDAALSGHVVSYAEWIPYRAAGRRFMEVSYAPYREPDGSISGVVSNSRDITERKQSEDILAARLRLSEAAAVLSFEELLRNGLDDAERLTGSRIGLFHLLDEAAQTFVHQTHSTRTEQECRALSQGLYFTLENAGVWADCVRERRPVIHNDYGALPHRRGLPPGHPAVERELVVPVIYQNRVVAVMGVGNKEHPYDLHDVAVVSNLSGLLWDIILRKQAEGERDAAVAVLAEREELFRNVFDLSPVGSCLIDLDRRFVRGNSSFCSFLGYTEQELIGKSYREVTHPDDLEVGAADLRALVEGALDRVQLQKRYLRKDGRAVWGEVHIRLLRDRSGRPQLFLPVIQDITARKQTEEALRETALFLSQAHRIARMGGWKANPRTDYLEWTDGVREIIETPNEYAPPLSEGLKFYLPIHIPVLKEKIERCLETGEPFAEECEVVTLTGRRIWTEVRGIKAVGEGGSGYVTGTFQDITERKKAEQQLTMQALVLDQAEDRVTIIGLDGFIRYVNRAQCQRLNCREEDLVGKPFYTFGDDPIRGVTQPELLRSTLRAGRWRGEILHRTSDGAESVVDCRTFLVRDHDGTPLAVCGIGTDVTERKRMEAALRESEGRYRALVEASPIPILVLLDGRCRFANPAALRLIGVSDLSGLNDAPVLEMIAPEYREMVARRFERLALGKGNDFFEYEILRPDGGRIAVESTSIPILFSGQPAGLVIGQDITERRRAQDTLRENAVFLMAAHRIARMGGWKANPNTDYLECSEGVYDIMEVPREYTPPLSEGLTFYLPAYIPVLKERLQRCLDSGEQFVQECEAVTAKGRRIWVEVRGIKPVTEGALTYVIGTVQDITERKQAEIEKRELDRRLQNAREEERRRIAREVHDELGQSLTALKIDLAWLQNKAVGLDERITEKIDSMDRRATETLSGVQRISSELRPGILDALGLSAAIEWLVRDFETRTDIHCQLSIEPEEISIGPAPAINIFRILQESLTNVARHSQASQVRVRLHRTEKEVQLLVVDNGVGIPDAAVFSRESIGLIGMRERVEVCGGRLKIHGLPGEGTLVRAAIPL